jgi:hypothetical protein
VAQGEGPEFKLQDHKKKKKKTFSVKSSEWRVFFMEKF